MQTKLASNQIKKYFNYMDDSLSHDYFSAILLGQKSFMVSDGLIEIWEEKRIQHKQKEKALLQTTKNNNIGIALEKNGDIKEAIKTYEKNIRIGYPALHSYERLMVLYKKEKMLDKEVEIIDKSIDLFSNEKGFNKYIEKWKSRKQKAIKTK